MQSALFTNRTLSKHTLIGTKIKYYQKTAMVHVIQCTHTPAHSQVNQIVFMVCNGPITTLSRT